MTVFDWQYALQILPTLAQASIITVQATLLSFCIAAVLGLVFAVLRMAPLAAVALPVALFVEAVRSMPLLIQILFIYFALPRFGVVIDALPAGVIALGLHYAAYCSEVYRAGLASVPRGQWEACVALNFGPVAALRKIIIPQAIPPVLPALGNYLIALFKDTPLLSAISVIELMQTAKTMGSTNFRYVEPITLVGGFFLLFSLAAALCVRRTEVWLHSYKGRK